MDKSTSTTMDNPKNSTSTTSLWSLLPWKLPTNTIAAPKTTTLLREEEDKNKHPPPKGLSKTGFTNKIQIA
jgi:hypothetical protein